APTHTTPLHDALPTSRPHRSTGTPPNPATASSPASSATTRSIDALHTPAAPPMRAPMRRPIAAPSARPTAHAASGPAWAAPLARSEEHTAELHSPYEL